MPAKSAAKVIDDESDGEAVARNGATEKGGTAAAIVEETQVVALKVKKERKVFDLPGQTKQLDPKAAESESLRIFYTTLREQRPESEIAPLWLMQHGLLPEEEAAELFKKVSSSRSKARAVGAGGASPSKGASKAAGAKRVRKPDPRRGGGKAAGAAAKGKVRGNGKAAAAPRKRAKKAASKAIVDDDDDDDDAFQPTAPKAKFVGKSAIIDDDDSD